MPTPTATNGYVDPKTAPPVEESSTDDFGYDTPPEEKVTPPVDDKAAPPKEEEKPVENPLTGYTKDDKAVDDKAAPPVDDAPATDDEKQITEVLKTLNDSFDKDKISKFAKEIKLTKSQVEAYVKLANEEQKELAKTQAEAVKTQRKVWKEELMSDPEFGGENFDKNVDRVEKVLQKHLPNTKKVLTEKGSMLPPYIMRDFLGLAKALNPTTNFVNGDPAEPPKQDGNFLEDLYGN